MNKINNILYVLVLYKRKVEDSETYESILKSTSPSQNINIYIHDNSPEKQTIQQVDNVRFYYYHDSTNPGVSKAYNNACLFAKSHGYKWMVILDQDTTLPSNAISIYNQAVIDAASDDMVFAPILKDKDKIVSPCLYLLHRGFHLKKIPENVIQTKNRSFLNSGLLIKCEFFLDVGGFDEELFDYSDHDFFIRVSKTISSVKLLPIEFNHSLSSNSELNKAQIVGRLYLLKKASRYVSKKYNTRLPNFWFYIRLIKICTKFSSLRMFINFINTER